jgi:hypothetical protein
MDELEKKYPNIGIALYYISHEYKFEPEYFIEFYGDEAIRLFDYLQSSHALEDKNEKFIYDEIDDFFRHCNGRYYTKRKQMLKWISYTGEED